MNSKPLAAPPPDLAAGRKFGYKVGVSLEHWLTLAMTPGLGPVRLRRLLEATGSPEAATQASAAQLARLDGIGGKTAADIASGLRSAKALVMEEVDKARALGITLVSLEDELYPPLLKQIADPPPVLWVWGSLEPRDLNAVAIVGSRRPSGYGKEQATRFGGLLATAGFTVVSGGAYGIDSCAHRGALRATDGRTIAVLGCGVDIAYPPEHEELFSQIADGGGAVISEHALGLPPRKENFPRRNRIISGMSRGILVVEADEQSGALITAREAAEQNRPVFAVPGRVDNPMSAGPHELLRTGAFLAARLDDIVENVGALSQAMDDPVAREAPDNHVLPDLFAASDPVPSTTVAVVTAEVATLGEADRKVLDALDGGSLTIDGLIETTAMPASRVQASLMLLGIKGFVRRSTSGHFERKR